MAGHYPKEEDLGKMQKYRNLIRKKCTIREI